MGNSEKENTSIEGTLLMLDDKTPHVAIVVQAVTPARGGNAEPTVVATTLSDENGDYQFNGLPVGQYQVRCYTLSGYVYHQEGKVLQVRTGRPLKGVDFRVAPFKKGIWRNYTYLDGLSDLVLAIHRDPDGVMWFATFDGVSRYDGEEFVNFTKKDRLVSGVVHTIYRDPDGMMWFGILGGKGDTGISRYDGVEFVKFTAEDGLAPGIVRDIYRDPDGILWIATDGGVSRYDGKEFVNFTEKDGLPRNGVLAIYRDPDGIMWFATGGGEGSPPRGAGVSRYDGKEFVNLTTEDGLAGNAVHAIQGAPGGVIWFATGGGVSRYDGKEFVNFTTEDGLANDYVRSIYRDSDGVLWFGTWGGGVSRYDGKGFVNFTTEDGLGSNEILAIYRDSDGVMWFGTWTGGLSRYDGEGLVNFTTKDGLAGNEVGSMYRDPDGVLWFGTGHWASVPERAEGAGVSKYDGRQVVSFTAEDGLADSAVLTIHRDPDGVMWFGTRDRGVSRYDGKEFVNFTEEDGLASDYVSAIYRAPDGVMWFGTGYWTRSGGVSRYDGVEFVNLTKENRLPGSVHAIHGAGNDAIWFGTWGGGVFRYDGQESINLTTEDGLVHDFVDGIYRDPDGVMWFGTWGGVSRYDGKAFANFTIEDGLASDRVYDIHRGTDGIIWFGTNSGGVSGYDGAAWTSLDTRDGLAGNCVHEIIQDPDGFLWFATEDGVTRYRPNATSPRAHIVSVTTDQTYRDLSAIPALTPGTRVTIEYSSIDLKTLPEKRQYRCRVYETSDMRLETVESRSPRRDVPYNPPTRDTTFDWTPGKPGTYTFEVQAIDRDLNYSEPASVKLEVIPDPRNHRIIQLEEHIRQQELAELERVHRELEDARQIQRSLLPTQAPEIESFDIAGTSVPAKEVSGDFYNYPSLDKNTGIVLADVTGKSVKAAMIAAMTNGMLNEAISARKELWNSPSMMLSRLNAGLQPHLMRGMFTAMSLGILQPEVNCLLFSNAGMPYPIVKRGKEVWELEVIGMPLGLMDEVEYQDLSFDMEGGDTVVFYSDGVIEAENGAGDMYQTERLLELIRGASSALSAQEMVDLIVGDVASFAGDEEASDDITIVVVRCEGVSG